MSVGITVERLERALALCAYLVVIDGPIAVPYFERIERELQAARSEQATVDRAKKLLTGYGVQATEVISNDLGALKAIR